MAEETKKGGVWQRLFRTVQLLCDPQAYARDEELRARKELDQRFRFYFLNDVNKHESRESDNPNIFTDEERLQWFGKKHLAIEDITWDRFEKILCPKETKGAVFRVNEALQGSHINERFSVLKVEGGNRRASRSEALYMPRTVTLYETKEQAQVAAKLLRILSIGSGATIKAEPIERATGQPQWVVSDNMDLQTHNALRLLMTHLAHRQTPQDRALWQKTAQREVDKRLPEGEKWEAYEGVGTFLTLAGRPGVKMYKKLQNGKDDPMDAKIVGRIPAQPLPALVHGVPHNTVFAPDGRRYMEPGNTKAIIGHLLLGPNGYSIVTTGSRRAMGHVLRRETKFLFEPLEQGTVFGRAEGAAEAFHTAPTKAEAVAVGLVSVIGVGTMMLVCTGSYKACQKIAKKLSKGKWEFDPIQNKLRPFVAAREGDPNDPQFTKTWKPRETGDALGLNGEDVMVSITPASDTEIGSVLGEVKLLPPDIAQPRWVESLDNTIGNKFVAYLRKKELWPREHNLTHHEATNPFHHKLGNDYYGARDHLAKAYAEWVQALLLHQEKDRPNRPTRGDITLATKQAMDKPSADLAARLNEYVKEVQTEPLLAGDTANHIMAQTREALRAGMEQFLNEKAQDAVALRA